MLKKRHKVAPATIPNAASIVTLARDYPSGHVIPPHSHDRDQLVYASQGVMTVKTQIGAWVIPPHRAVWIPAGIVHTIAMSGKVAMRTLYLLPGEVPRLPRACCVVSVSPLLRELVVHACTFGALDACTPEQAHVLGMIRGLLDAIESLPLQLPLPTDSRALRVAEQVSAAPTEAPALDDLCRSAGASRRTVERLFREETGMTLGKWRHQTRLMAAMQALGSGAKIAEAAFEAGYSTPSAFIAAFRMTFGLTPARYFRAQKTVTDPEPR